MDELISKQTITKQAAINVLKERIKANGYSNTALISELNRSISYIYYLPPTEIIRCKDCKHYQFADNRAFGMPVKMCKWFRFEDVDDDDYCSRAERRSDE